jgi:hypothetical protein|tara:strand:+ start:63 stop:476 length:414 start_codon:yes stop_codon:yes gene_type:complete
MTEIEEKYLPNEILQKAIVSGNEYGWKRTDFKNVLEKAVENGLGIIGGQVQFKFLDGTCELYWHKYDSTEKQNGENWTEYCKRTKNECLNQFENLPSDSELVKDGIENFEFLKEKKDLNLNLTEYLIFILYFAKRDE